MPASIQHCTAAMPFPLTLDDVSECILSCIVGRCLYHLPLNHRNISLCLHSRRPATILSARRLPTAANFPSIFPSRSTPSPDIGVSKRPCRCYCPLEQTLLVLRIRQIVQVVVGQTWLCLMYRPNKIFGSSAAAVGARNVEDVGTSAAVGAWIVVEAGMVICRMLFLCANSQVYLSPAEQWNTSLCFWNDF